MGNESGRTRKFILHFFTACCIAAVSGIIACAPVQDKIATIEAHHHLERYRKNLAGGFFETVVQQSKQVVEENELAPRAEVALYALGEVYAHHDYKGRNYEISQSYFEKLIKNFPDSPLASEAKVYISLFETITAKEKVATAATAAAKAAANKQKQSEKNHIPVTKEKKNIPLIPEPRKVVENQNFEEALKKNQQILDQAGEQKPADEAYYNLGLIYAHIDNPGKDYNKSQSYFYKLTEQFPESEFAEEARIWLGLFETIEQIQQIDVEIDQQKKKLIR